VEIDFEGEMEMYENEGKQKELPKLFKILRVELIEDLY